MKWTSRVLPGGLGVSRGAPTAHTTGIVPLVSTRSCDQALSISSSVRASESDVDVQDGHAAKQTRPRSAATSERTSAAPHTDLRTQSHTCDADTAMPDSGSNSRASEAVQHNRLSKKRRTDVAGGRAAHEDSASEDAPSSLHPQSSCAETIQTTKASHMAIATSSVEAMRAKAVKKLRSALHRECTKHGVRPPLLCVERWLFRNASPPDSAEVSNIGVTSTTATSDPVLPSLAGADRALVRDLVRAGLSSDVAEAIAKRISALALVEVAALAKATPCRTDVAVCVARGEVRFSLGTATRPYVRCNTSCYEKLCELWRTTEAAKTSFGARDIRVHTENDGVACDAKEGDKRAASTLEESSRDDRDHDARMHHDIYCLLTRYDTIAGEGYQAALPALPFGVLQRRLGVTCECFASPLNSTLSRCVSICFP